MSQVRHPYPAVVRQQMFKFLVMSHLPALLIRVFRVTTQSKATWIGQAAINDGKPLPGMKRPPQSGSIKSAFIERSLHP